MTEPNSPSASLELLNGKAVVDNCPLSPAQPIVIGRGEKADWRYGEESFLSRRHVEVVLKGNTLKVRKLPEASNAVIHAGEARDEFVLQDGDSFVIGRTKFRFTLARQEKVAHVEAAQPSLQHTVNASDLYVLGKSADKFRLQDLLELPEILRAKDRAGFYTHIAGMLRLATQAAWSCVLTEDGKILGEDCADDMSRFKVSRTLLLQAVSDSPQPTLFCWSGQADALNATAVAGVDWAICAAAKIPDESALAFYVAGSGPTDKDSQDSYKESARFVGLVADIVGRSLSADRLQAQEKRLEHYFSGPVVKKILKSANPADLEPKQANGTVMFFDIRGFSKKTEGSMEKMVEYLREIKRVMMAMTGIILEEHGVVLQYIGDAIYACWNLPYEDPEHINSAVRAAMRMNHELPKITDGWRCGIGLHFGNVVAGAMGSEQIFSYGVMGPVVNQASRIEGITKQVGVSILASREVAERLSKAVAVPLRIGRFQPAGMEVPLDLYELSGAPGDPKRERIFSEGLAAFEAGDWAKAYEALRTLPLEDMPARFIMSLAEEHRKTPPKAWRGLITLTQK